MKQKDRKLLHALASRHGRKKSGMFLCEGIRACEEALMRRPEWHVLTVCSSSFSASSDSVRFREMADRSGGEIEVVSDHEFESAAITENPQGILCVLRRPVTPVPTDPVDPFVLILDRLADPGNLGTILRTAWAIGLGSVWLTEGCTDPFGPKAIRAGMGGQFALALFQCRDLCAARDLLQSVQYETLWCTVPAGGISCYSDDFRLQHSGLVIGNEANGIEDPSIGRSVTIPMPGEAESLNAAQAATIFLFEGVRRGIVARS